MALTSDEFLKRPLYVFDLPHELLVTLHLKTLGADRQLRKDSEPVQEPFKEKGLSLYGDIEQKASTSCALCSASFPNVQEQRQHVRSDWHRYNLKQRLRGQSPVTEIDFGKLLEDLDESISGSESSESEDDDQRKEDSTLTALLKKQAHIINASDDTDIMRKRRKRGSGKPPILWFATSLLPSNTSLGVYRALFTEAEQEEASIIETMRQKQLTPTPEKPMQSGSSNSVPLPTTMTSPHIFLCMIGGGHFAAMIVSLAPKLEKKASGPNVRQAIILVHKTFHRYTTRRKQGGSQSANDSAKGAAHSAGSSLRRYNEVALEAEIRALLGEWRHLIEKSQLIFVRATGSTNRRTLFGPYEGQVLRHNDPRNRSFPFSTRRATQAELMRAFVELTRVKVSEVDEAALAATAAAEQAFNSISAPKPPSQKPVPSKITKEEESLQLHTTQLQSLIRRSKAAALLAYLAANLLPPNFIFEPRSTHANHHAPTPMHLAASINSSVVIIALLTRTAADPTIQNGEGKVPFDLSGDRATRDAFRVTRHELGEDRWDWNAAHVPPPLTKVEADQREAREKAETEKAETERRKAETKRLEEETTATEEAMVGKKSVGRTLAVEKTGAEKREEETRGLTPEMRMRLERERRARAAEERMRKLGGGRGQR